MFVKRLDTNYFKADEKRLTRSKHSDHKINIINKSNEK